MGSQPVGISASRAAAVLGVSPWRTPVDAWAELCEERDPAVPGVNPGFCARVGIAPPEPVDNAAVRWGSAFEDEIIRLAERVTQTSIIDRERLYTRDMDGCVLTCHIDGRYEPGAALHEGKTTSLYAFHDKWGEPGSDRIPREYQVQVQLQMALTGIEQAIVSVLVWPLRVEEIEAAGTLPDQIDCAAWADVFARMGLFHQYVVNAAPDLQRQIVEGCVDFWRRYVLTETPPPAQTYSDIRRLLPEPRGTVVADEQTERWCAEYKQITAEEGNAKKRKDELKTLILAPTIAAAEFPIDKDSVEAIVIRDRAGHKLNTLSKDKNGKLTFR